MVMPPQVAPPERSSPPPSVGGMIGSLTIFAQRVASSGPVQMSMSVLPPTLVTNGCWALSELPGVFPLFQFWPAPFGDELKIWVGPSSQPTRASDATKLRTSELRIGAP